MPKSTTRSKSNQQSNRNGIATNPFRKWRSSAGAGSSPGEPSIAEIFSPRETHGYCDWDQFELLDEHGEAVSPTTRRRCDPFKNRPA